MVNATVRTSLPSLVDLLHVKLSSLRIIAPTYSYSSPLYSRHHGTTPSCHEVRLHCCCCLSPRSNFSGPGSPSPWLLRGLFVATRSPLIYFFPCIPRSDLLWLSSTGLLQAMSSPPCHLLALSTLRTR